MEGVTIIETKVLQSLISSVEDLKFTVLSTISELKDSQSTYMDTNSVIEFTGFKKTWVNAHKIDLGGRMVGGELRFKRSDVIDFMEQNNLRTKKRAV